MRRSHQRLGRLHLEGRLPTLKDGSRLLFRRSDIDRYLGNGGDEGRSKALGLTSSFAEAGAGAPGLAE